MLATKDIADFPFLGRDYAKQISSIKFDIQLIDDYILNILKHKKTELSLIDSLQTFIGSFVVISNIHDHRVKTLFSNNLTYFYVNKLKSIYKKDVEDFEVYFDEIFKEIFNYGDNCVKRLKNNTGFVIKVPQFLKISPGNLINHDVIGGYVMVDIFKILENGFKRYFTDKLKKKKELFGLDTLVIKYDNYIPVTKKKVSSDNSLLPPPCISHLMSDFQNPSHFQRLVMATYLLKLQKEDDEIVSIFSNTQDFNEKVTRYQLNQIKQREYEVPNCDKIDIGGFCFRDSKICGKCKNPMQLLSS